MVYVTLDEKSVQGLGGKEKNGRWIEKKQDKEHIGTPKENIRWIGTKEGLDSRWCRERDCVCVCVFLGEGSMGVRGGGFRKNL
jgi:hypothetical protein